MVLKAHMKILHRINTIQQKYDEQVTTGPRSLLSTGFDPHPKAIRLFHQSDIV